MRNAGSIVAGFLVIGGIIAAVTVMNQVSAQQKAEEEAAKARAAQATATAIAARQPTPRPGQPAQAQPQQRPAGQQAQPAQQQQQQRPAQQSGGQAQAARSSAPQQFRPAVRETPPKYPTVTLIVSTTFPDLTVTVGLNRDVRQGPRVSLNGSPPRDPVLAEDGTKIVQFENVPVGRHELVLYVPPYLPDIPPQTFRRTITISGNEPVARFSFG